MAEQHLALGKVVKAWGLKGELKVQPYADSIEMVAEISPLYLKRAGGRSR
ncbi:MAG: hypothetical protein M5R38_18220 [Candidatus Methylomirabilis sp.]|nr:hypothetical protein [Candidatus Methylomirabilis sp.]